MLQAVTAILEMKKDGHKAKSGYGLSLPEDQTRMGSSARISSALQDYAQRSSAHHRAIFAWGPGARIEVSSATALVYGSQYSMSGADEPC